MALDEAMMIWVGEREEAPPTLRVYGWSPPAVSIGYFQRVEGVVNLQQCQRLGLDVVKRPTGGRAVLHWGDLTYSIVAREEDIGAESIVESHRRISMALVAGLRDIGVQAEIQSGRRGLRGLGFQPCFSSVVRHEVAAGGRKLVGSAQRRKMGVLLQHGSLPLTDEYLRIEEVLPSSSRVRRGFLESRTVSLTRVLGRPCAFQEVAEAICRGFRKVFDIRLIPGGISTWELALAHNLLKKGTIFRSKG